MEDWQPQTERFDDTWPYNFKWAVTRYGDVHVWRTRGGKDGMPTHRKEFMDNFGYESEFRKGDILGLATFIPAEAKIDGTIVAPPEVQTQAYYGHDTPQAVNDWFENTFPGVVIRQTNIVKPKLTKTAELDDFDNFGNDWGNFETYHGEELIIKWVYNEKNGFLMWETDERGLPTHNQKIEMMWLRSNGPDDFLGYAIPIEGEDAPSLEIETYRGGVPPKVYQRVKEELAKEYPGANIILPQQAEEFHTDPQKLTRHYRAAEWARENLSRMPVKAPESLSKPQEDDILGRVSQKLTRGLKRLLSNQSEPLLFITDGTNSISKPANEADRDELEEEFNQIYPDAEMRKRYAIGLAFPTDDKMGYRIDLERVGMGSKEPSIDQIIAALDDHLGVPTHIR